MNVVYAFEYCSCIFDSDFTVRSLHATKAGAYKAMRADLVEACEFERMLYLRYGCEPCPLEFTKRRIREIQVLP